MDASRSRNQQALKQNNLYLLNSVSPYTRLLNCSFKSSRLRLDTALPNVNGNSSMDERMNMKMFRDEMYDNYFSVSIVLTYLSTLRSTPGAPRQDPCPRPPILVELCRHLCGSHPTIWMRRFCSFLLVFFSSGGVLIRCNYIVEIELKS